MMDTNAGRVFAVDIHIHRYFFGLRSAWDFADDYDSLLGVLMDVVGKRQLPLSFGGERHISRSEIPHRVKAKQDMPFSQE